MVDITTRYSRPILYFYFDTEVCCGAYARPAIIFLGFTVLTEMSCITSTMRGVANRVEPRTLTSRVTMKTIGRVLTGIEKEWSHAQSGIII